MNETAAEKNALQTADAKGQYEPPKLTVLSLDETATGSSYSSTDGVTGYDNILS